jgi:hypothetical protein
MSLPKRVVLTMTTQRMIANHPLSTQKNIQSLITNNILSIQNTKLEITKFVKKNVDIKKK